MRSGRHRLELGHGVDNLERFVPFQVLKDCLRLVCRGSLDADRVSLALQDLERGSSNHDLLVQVLRLAFAIASHGTKYNTATWPTYRLAGGACSIPTVVSLQKQV